MKKISLLFITCLFIAKASLAQFAFRGLVVDGLQQPLPSVSITIAGNSFLAFTDSSGRFQFPFYASLVSITCSHIGFETFTKTIGSDSSNIIVMKPGQGFLSETVVYAFEQHGILKNLPAPVAILNRSTLEKFSNESFVAAVNSVPGVKMDERSPGSYRLNIRGNLLRSSFGVRNVKVYWNGIPFTGADGNTYFNEIAFNNIGKIEILKGPSGSMYGAGTGGVVLLSGNLPDEKAKRISIETNTGSYGLFNAGIAFNNSNTSSATSFSFNHQQSDGYRVHTNMRRDVLNYAAKYRVDEKQEVQANILYSDLYYQTPGALTISELRSNPQQARPAAGIFKSAEAQKAAIYLKTIYAGIGSAYRFNSRWSNHSSMYVSSTNFRNPAIRNYERKTEQGIGARTVTTYSNKNFTGVIGGEYQYGFTNTSTFGNKLGEIDTLQIHDEIDSRQFNIFLQAGLQLPLGFLLSAGISYNNFHYGFTRLNQLPSVKQSNDFKPNFIPRISLGKKINASTNLYASWSKGYSPPSIDEVHAGDGNFNKGLRAEEGQNAELGIKANLFRNKVFIDASGYLFWLNNTIVGRRDASGGDYFVNAGKTKQQGLEMVLEYYVVNNKNGFLRQLKLRSSYSYINATFEQYTQGALKYDGNRLTGTSPNIFSGGIDIKTSVGLYLNTNYNYTDKIALNDANSFYAPAYQLMFVKLGYTFMTGKYLHWNIYTGYNKSFNNPYSLGNDLNAAGSRFYNASAPQLFSGGIKLDINLP